MHGAQVTADHGNADDMVQRAKKTNEPLKNEKGELQLLTSHTLVRPSLAILSLLSVA